MKLQNEKSTIISYNMSWLFFPFLKVQKQNNPCVYNFLQIKEYIYVIKKE